ncbi:LLM class flavin-dependent oxidoreductase [Pseudonocardia xinjiangensis]|uniref:LLM class flavin-dependent oxidoreductase n=1 Tax=Pseudonocardia xinjiangensis TaxID=75289 RepID=A0ABX1RDS0_9PSEU|nr:LLM class flavin-dependent oxidoreductase [Pseudonocardia xinjiangensis]NMH77270.1 LLM class flavin-dependent oxidoreductase [Pseudonocardia xinjiangensis]
MTDYGHDLLFGANPESPPEGSGDIVELAKLTEQVGLDLVTIADHPYIPDQLDTMALLSVIAARTSTLRVLPALANLPLRPPVALARTAATLDILSDGRFELGVGSGAVWDQIAAEGGPRHTPGESIAALEEAVRIIRALWTPGDPVRFDGRHYRLDGVAPGPFPVHDIPIWLGAYRPRMLQMTGRIADCWLPSSPYLPPEHLAAANAIIDEAASDAGRAPQAVRRAYNIAGEFTAEGGGFLQGPPKAWVEQLAELALTQGISTFILYRIESADVIRQFAAETVPAVREIVAAERGRPSGQPA